MIRAVCRVSPLTEETHWVEWRIAEPYRAAIDDAMIVSAALLSSCPILCSEDMQHGLVIDQRLLIENPFL